MGAATDLSVVRVEEVGSVKHCRVSARSAGIISVGMMNMNNNNKGTMGHVIRYGVRSIRFVTMGDSGPTLTGSRTSRGVLVNRGTAGNVNTNTEPRMNGGTTSRDGRTVASTVANTRVMFVATNVNNNANANTTPIITRITGSLNVLAINIIAAPFTFRNGRHVSRTRTNVGRLTRCISSVVIVPGRGLGFIAGREVALLGTFRVTGSILHRNIRSVSSLIGTANLMGYSFTSIARVVGSSNCTRVNINHNGNGSGTRITTRTTVSDPLLGASVSNTHNILLGVATSSSVKLRRVSITSAVIGGTIRPSYRVV